MDVEVISRRTKAKSAARRYREQYRGCLTVPFYMTAAQISGRTPLQIIEELEALGPDPHPDDVDAVTGNSSWTAVSTACDVCDHIAYGSRVLFRLGDVCICEECVQGLMAQLAAENEAMKKLVRHKDKQQSDLLEPAAAAAAQCLVAAAEVLGSTDVSCSLHDLAMRIRDGEVWV